MYICRAWHHNIYPTGTIQTLCNPGALHQYPGAMAVQVSAGPNEASTCFSPGFKEASAEGSCQLPLEENHYLIFYVVVKISQWYKYVPTRQTEPKAQLTIPSRRQKLFNIFQKVLHMCRCSISLENLQSHLLINSNIFNSLMKNNTPVNNHQPLFSITYAYSATSVSKPTKKFLRRSICTNSDLPAGG